MKRILLILDGAADQPVDELDGRTPMHAARTPNLDRLAARGRVGRTCPVPEEMPLGADVATMALLGYDPMRYYTGRGPIEAASVGIPVEGRDTAFCISLVSTDGETLLDAAGGGLTVEEGAELVEALQTRIFHTNDSRRLYPLAGHRHMMVWTDGPTDLRCVDPRDFVGQHIVRYMPEGDGDQSIRRKIWDSLEVLDSHPVNQRRRAEGKLPANLMWPWGPGRRPEMPSFFSLRGSQGVAVAAIPAVKGVARLAGLSAPNIPGATGRVETDWAGKAADALEALEEGRDFALIHVNGPNDAGRQGDAEAKVYALEQTDSDLVGPLLDGLGAMGDFRFLCLPDYSTPVRVRLPDGYNVPFMFYDTQDERGGGLPFDERGMRGTRFRISEGYRLPDLLFA